MRIVVCLSLALASSGCLVQHMQPAERLRESVIALNDEARWTRMDLAAERVSPEYRERWTKNHHDWGRGIQIGDMELVDLKIDEQDNATSIVSISWYRY